MAFATISTSGNGYTISKTSDTNVIAEISLFSGFYRYYQTSVTTTKVYKGLSATEAQEFIATVQDNLSSFTETLNEGTLTAYTVNLPLSVGTKRRASAQQNGDSPFWTVTVEESVLTVTSGV